MAKNNNLTDFMVSVANAIRTKKGTSGAINPQNFDSEILSIEGMPSSTKALANVISGEVATDETTLNNAIAKGATDTPETATFTERTTADGGTIKDTIARIDKVKGNCVKYNQGVSSSMSISCSKGTITFNGDIGTYTISAVSANYWDNRITIARPSYITGHKYLEIARILPRYANDVRLAHDSLKNKSNAISVTANQWNNIYQVFTAEDGLKIIWVTLNCGTNYAVGDTIQINKKVLSFDLTAMGKEDITTADGMAEYLGYSSVEDLLNSPYQSDTIVLTNSQNSVTSKSRNIFTEQMELGYLYATGTTIGTNRPSSTQIRTNGYISCKGGTRYYVNTSSTIFIFGYDENHAYVPMPSVSGDTLNGNTYRYGTANNGCGTFTTPSNVCYLRFYATADYGTTYKNDICIEEGSEGHGYMAYGVLDNLPTNARNLTDSEGSTIFPNGLCSVGDVHDEWDMAKGVAVKRILSVDLGTLAWTGPLSNNRGFVTTQLATKIAGKRNAICANYPVYNGFISDNILSNSTTSIMGFNTSGNAYIKDIDKMSLTNAQFKSAMSGVMLYVELATPITYNVAPCKAYYKVSQNGKEIANSTELSAPFKADIAYRGMSAEELINELNG